MKEIKHTILLEEHGFIVYVTEDKELYGLNFRHGTYFMTARHRMEKIEDIEFNFYSDKSRDCFNKSIEEIKQKYC